MKKYIMKITITTTLLFIAIIVCFISIFMVILDADHAFADSGAEKRYYSASQNISTRAVKQEIINYTSYSVLVDCELAAPSYASSNANLTNPCAAVAGANIIGFYDCEYENLIPDYSPAIIRGGKKVFKPATSTIQNVIDDLYVRMRTNLTGEGVTKSEFNDGLRSYVNSAGYNATIVDIANSGQVNVNSIKSNIDNGNPMILFCTMNYFVSSIDIGSNSTTLTEVDYQSNHIMVVNGIKQVAYYQDGINFRTDTYLKVSIGLQEYSSAYILLSSIELDYLETLAIN